MKSEHILIEGRCLEKLEQQGYNIQCWKEGIPLVREGKYLDSLLLNWF